MILTAKPQNGRTYDKAQCISSLICKGTKSTFRVRAACWEETNVVTAGHTYTRFDPWPDDNKLKNVTRITHYRVTDYRRRVIAVIFFVRVISDMSRSSTTFETIWHLSSELINEILYKYRESRHSRHNDVKHDCNIFVFSSNISSLLSTYSCQFIFMRQLIFIQFIFINLIFYQFIFISYFLSYLSSTSLLCSSFSFFYESLFLKRDTIRPSKWLPLSDFPWFSFISRRISLLN